MAALAVFVLREMSDVVERRRAQSEENEGRKQFDAEAKIAACAPTDCTAGGRMSAL